MTKFQLFSRYLLAAALPMTLLCACDDKDDPTPNPDGTDQETQADGLFVFASQVEGSNGTANVLVTGTSLDDGSVSTVGRGLTNDGATQWVFYKNFLYALTYNQGNAGTTRSYILGENGEMKARDIEYKITRFSSYGTYNDYILTMSTGAGPAQFADAKGNLPMTLLVTYLDVLNETATTNDTSTGAYSMENFLGNGEYVTLAGAEQSGNLLYCGAVPMGLSAYGSNDGDGKWIRKFEDGTDNKDLVKTESGGTGSGAYTAGELSGTQYPDECWVAIYDNKDLLNPTKIKTDKISTPCGRYRSQYYQTVWAAENGDIYVFSSSYAKTMTDKRQQTTLPAGVCRIKAGTKSFDDYYVDLEAQTPGGNRSFMRCWPAGGSCFLMQMYDRSLTEKNPVATEVAIFNADTRKLTYVSGMPENVTSLGKDVYVHDGKVYIAVNVENEHPAIYAIDNQTCTATKGVTVEAAAVNGFGFMTPRK